MRLAQELRARYFRYIWRAVLTAKGKAGQTAADETAAEVFWHGKRAQLSVGDLIMPGYRSNYGSRRQANFVYFAATRRRRAGARSWRRARGGRGSMWWRRPVRMRTTRT